MVRSRSQSCSTCSATPNPGAPFTPTATSWARAPSCSCNAEAGPSRRGPWPALVTTPRACSPRPRTAGSTRSSSTPSPPLSPHNALDVRAEGPTAMRFADVTHLADNDQRPARRRRGLRTRSCAAAPPHARGRRMAARRSAHAPAHARRPAARPLRGPVRLGRRGRRRRVRRRAALRPHRWRDRAPLRRCGNRRRVRKPAPNGPRRKPSWSRCSARSSVPSGRVRPRRRPTVLDGGQHSRCGRREQPARASRRTRARP